MIKSITSDQNEQSYNFKNNESPISIGRSDSCNLSLNLKTFSRVQCICEYMKSRWYIIDGDGSKGSTNGTWLLLSDEREISNNMLIRAAETNFKITFLS